MAAYVIPIFLDSSEESVGSHVLIVPVGPLVAPEMGAVSVTSHSGMLDLVDYLFSSDSDPSKDSLPLALELPLVSPYLCADDSKANIESKPAEHRPERHESLAVHDAMVSRWKDKVASRLPSPSRSSSQDTLSPLFEFPIALVVAPPGIRRRPAILSQPEEAIPFDRHSSPDFTSDSSFSGSSLDSSLDTFLGSPSDSFSDTSLVHFSGCNASESSLKSSSERSLDSSSLSAGPSRKRCRSPTTSVPSSTPVLRSIAPTLADLLPTRKRFRDSDSYEDSRQEHIEIGTADAEAAANLGISDGVGAHTKDGICLGVEIVASDIRKDEEEFKTAQR
nr:hypothetical protein [Tanacetum cinerariifolium]